MTKTSIADNMARVKPFSLLTREELERLAGVCTARRIEAGDLIYSEDDWIDHLWALTDGMMRVSLTPPLGGHAAVSVMRPGDLVGCLNVDCRHKHPSEGLAVTYCTVIVIPKERYSGLLDNKDFGRGIIHVLGERLWESQTIRAVAGQPSEQRMAWTLLWLHGKFGQRVPMTRRMIAETAGIARETAIRLLSPLEKKGWLKTKRGVLEILKPEKLKELLEAR